LFNLSAALIALALFAVTIPLLVRASNTIDGVTLLAGYHTAYNVVGVAVLLPLIDRFTRFVEATHVHTACARPRVSSGRGRGRERRIGVGAWTAAGQGPVQAGSELSAAAVSRQTIDARSSSWSPVFRVASWPSIVALVRSARRRG
jgi:hypothetical protein